MKKDVTDEMRAEHERCKKMWIDAGCPDTFYNWLLDRIDAAMIAQGKLNA